jgi:hypothetical protein
MNQVHETILAGIPDRVGSRGTWVRRPFYIEHRGTGAWPVTMDRKDASWTQAIPEVERSLWQSYWETAQGWFVDA